MLDTKTETASGKPGAFPSTRWSLVSHAGTEDETARLNALDALLRVYCPALQNHLVRNGGMPRHRAEDLVQGFVADKILRKNLLAEADRTRGKFRSFLLKALSNYVASQIRRERAQKRGGHAEMVALDEERDGLASPTLTGGGFDAVWARQILLAALHRMRAACLEQDRETTWSLFECRVLAPAIEGVSPIPYDELVRRFDLVSPSRASNLLITAKRMFRRTLREVVRDTVTRDAEVETEIRDLCRILGDKD